MKRIFLSTALASVLLLGYSCKTKDKENANGDATTTGTSTAPAQPTTTTPVEVAGDEQLRQGVQDATKDIKGLTTRVENGTIYMSGTISREDNMRITPTLNSLKPKAINRDNLTVQQ